ncbi:hypothetical protein JCM16358_00660 [Halanaerocella petrolearia]
MKRSNIWLVLSLLLVIMLVGCSSPDNTETISNSSSQTTKQETTVKESKNKKESNKEKAAESDAKTTSGTNFKSAKLALIKAAKEGNLDLVKQLLKEGSKVNFQDQKGRTPLIYAAYNGHLAVIDQLLDYQADYNLKDKKGQTALDYLQHYLEASKRSPDSVEVYQRLKKLSNGK